MGKSDEGGGERGEGEATDDQQKQKTKQHMTNFQLIFLLKVFFLTFDSCLIYSFLFGLNGGGGRRGREGRGVERKNPKNKTIKHRQILKNNKSCVSTHKCRLIKKTHNHKHKIKKTTHKL